MREHSIWCSAKPTARSLHDSILINLEQPVTVSFSFQCCHVVERRRQVWLCLPGKKPFAPWRSFKWFWEAWTWTCETQWFTTQLMIQNTQNTTMRLCDYVWLYDSILCTVLEVIWICYQSSEGCEGVKSEPRTFGLIQSCLQSGCPLPFPIPRPRCLMWGLKYELNRWWTSGG